MRVESGDAGGPVLPGVPLESCGRGVFLVLLGVPLELLAGGALAPAGLGSLPCSPALPRRPGRGGGQIRQRPRSEKPGCHKKVIVF